MSDKYKYETDSKKWITLHQFFQDHKDEFPILCMVTEGEYGLTVYDDLPNDTAIRIHKYTSQRRVIAKQTEHSFFDSLVYYSIPADTSYKLCVIKGHNKVGEPQSLRDILAENKFPIQVTFPKKQGHVKVGESEEETKRIGTCLLIDEYEENFLICNSLNEGGSVISTGFMTLACTKSMNCALITGLTGKSEADFQAHCKQLNSIVAKSGVVVPTTDTGNPNITKFTETQTGSGNPLPHTDPPLFRKPNDKLEYDDSDDHDDLYEVPPKIDDGCVPPVPPRGKNIKTTVSRKNEITNKTEEPAKKGTKPYENSACAVVPPMFQGKQPSILYRRSSEERTPTETNQASVFTRACSEEGAKTPDDDYYIAMDTPIETSPEPPPRGQLDSSTSKDQVAQHEAMLQSLTVKEVGDKLRLLNLKTYVKIFAQNMVDGTCLAEFDREVLSKDFKLKYSEAIRLEKFIKTGHIPK